MMDGKAILWIAVSTVALTIFAGCGWQPAGQERRADEPALKRLAREPLFLYEPGRHTDLENEAPAALRLGLQ